MTDNTPEHGDIHVRLQALANTLSKRTAGPGSATAPLTVSDLVRPSVITLLNERTDILEPDKHEHTELSRQLRRIGTNLNQLAHAYQAGLLVQLVDTGDLFSELKAELVKTLALVHKIGQGSVTYNGHFLAHVTRRLRTLRAPSAAGMSIPVENSPLPAYKSTGALLVPCG